MRYSPRGALAMWLALAIILILLWVGGFLLFHIAAFALHLLLIIAAAALVYSPYPRRPQSRVAKKLLAVVQQAKDVILFEPVASFEKVKLDGEGKADNPGPQPAN